MEVDGIDGLRVPGRPVRPRSAMSCAPETGGICPLRRTSSRLMSSSNPLGRGNRVAWRAPIFLRSAKGVAPRPQRGHSCRVKLRVDIGVDADADARELDGETLELRRELLELDVDAVERPTTGPPPPGTRAVEAALLCWSRWGARSLARSSGRLPAG